MEVEKAPADEGIEHGRPSPLSPKEWEALDTVAKEGFSRNDQADMRRMGKSQQFRRNFKLITTIGFTTCVMGTWEILLTANTQGLVAGGLSGLFWSLCWAYVGQFFIVLSLAEMAAMAPTAGGQYVMSPNKDFISTDTSRDTIGLASSLHPQYNAS